MKGSFTWAAVGSLIPDPAIKELPWAAWQGFELPSHNQTHSEVTPGLPGHPEYHLLAGRRCSQSEMIPLPLGFDLSVTENGATPKEIRVSDSLSLKWDLDKVRMWGGIKTHQWRLDHILPDWVHLFYIIRVSPVLL